MVKRKVSKKSKRRLVIFGIPSLIIIAYAISTTIYYSVNLFKVRNENKALETELKQLQNDEENLRIQIQKLKDPEYVARYARENYLYSKDGEYIIKLDSKKEDEKEVEEQGNNYIYYAIIGVCVVAILVVIIPKKNKPVE